MAASTDGKASRTRRPRYWLIAEHEFSRTNAFTIDLTDGEKALAVFSFEEEAELFLHHELLGTRWQVREMTIGGLVSMLYNLYPGVGKVALDPLPNICGGINGLLSLRREEFVLTLIDGPGAPRCANQRPVNQVIEEHVPKGKNEGERTNTGH